MISFPNAKINLGLNVLKKRPDGFHEIESCFYPIPLKDVLEIVPAEEFKFESSGLKIPGDQNTNLCVKAFSILKEQFDIPPVHIHLHKVIPMGAGLGGGSSDGAFTLKTLGKLFDIQLSVEELWELSAQLGSDCPFFIENKPVLAIGTGTTFKPIDIDLSGKFLVLAHSNIHIGTEEAYGRVKPQEPDKSVSQCLSNEIIEWKDCLKNDFETAIFPHHGEIESIKNFLYDNGALYASMTGSGSSVYGLFNREKHLENCSFYPL